MAQILVVDDEIGIRELLSEILADEGHQVLLAESAGEARRLREREQPTFDHSGEIRASNVESGSKETETGRRANRPGSGTVARGSAGISTTSRRVASLLSFTTTVSGSANAPNRPSCSANTETIPVLGSYDQPNEGSA